MPRRWFYPERIRLAPSPSSAQPRLPRPVLSPIAWSPQRLLADSLRPRPPQHRTAPDIVVAFVRMACCYSSVEMKDWHGQQVEQSRAEGGAPCASAAPTHTRSL